MKTKSLLQWAMASVAVVALAGAAQAQTFGGLRDTFNNYRIDRIKHVVVIYAENRSFDNLYGDFPGADGLNNANATSFFRIQKDRNGSVLKVLPPVWGGLTAAGVTPVITQAQTENMPNQLFALDDANSYNVSIGVTTRDLWHRFYQNQMQIDNGANDKFAAWADSGGLVMGHYIHDPKNLPLWRYAQRYHARRPFLHGRVRRLVPQSPISDLLLRADLSQRRHERRERLDRGRQS